MDIALKHDLNIYVNISYLWIDRISDGAGKWTFLGSVLDVLHDYLHTFKKPTWYSDTSCRTWRSKYGHKLYRMCIRFLKARSFRLFIARRIATDKKKAPEGNLFENMCKIIPCGYRLEHRAIAAKSDPPLAFPRKPQSAESHADSSPAWHSLISNKTHS